MRIPLLVLAFLLALSLPSFAGDQPKEIVGMWQVVLPAEFQAQIDEMEKTLQAKPDDEMAKAMIEGMKQAAEMKMEFTADGRAIAHMGEQTEEASWTAVAAGTNTWTLTTVDKAGTKEDVKAVIEKDVLSISDESEDPPLQFTRLASKATKKK